MKVTVFIPHCIDDLRPAVVLRPMSQEEISVWALKMGLAVAEIKGSAIWAFDDHYIITFCSSPGIEAIIDTNGSYFEKSDQGVLKFWMEVAIVETLMEVEDKPADRLPIVEDDPRPTPEAA